MRGRGGKNRVFTQCSLPLQYKNGVYSVVYRRRRYARRTGSSYSRRQSHIVRVNGVTTISPGAGSTYATDLLENYEGSGGPGVANKDLSPCSIVGVRGHYTWTLPAAAAVAAGGTVGIGLMGESKDIMRGFDSLPDETKGRYSPLDDRGRYRRWHARSVSFAVEPAESGYQASQQASDNTTGLRVKSTRRLYTADDSYYLFADTRDLEEDLSLYWELTVFVREP